MKFQFVFILLLLLFSCNQEDKRILINRSTDEGLSEIRLSSSKLSDFTVITKSTNWYFARLKNLLILENQSIHLKQGWRKLYNKNPENELEKLENQIIDSISGHHNVLEYYYTSRKLEFVNIMKLISSDWMGSVTPEFKLVYFEEIVTSYHSDENKLSNHEFTAYTVNPFLSNVIVKFDEKDQLNLILLKGLILEKEDRNLDNPHYIILKEAGIKN